MIPTDAHTVLDVGCKDGLLLESSSDKTVFSVGLDINLASLKSVKFPVVNATAENLPFKDKTFDLVVCAEVLEHLTHSELENAVSELKRVSKKYILISVPFKEFLDMAWTKCKNCGEEYHLWGHKQSFHKEDFKKTFLPSKLTLTKIIRGNQRRFDPYLLRIRNKLLNGWSYDQAVSCPRCGMSSEPPHIGVSRRMLLILLSAFNLMLNPFRNYGGWLIALFDNVK